jgi:general secretion pathway protein G
MTLNYSRGLTLLEVLMTLVIISILASVAMPLAKVSIRRQKELELRRNLRILREAIDKYKTNYDNHLYQKEESPDRSGYPLTLDELVEKKILRKIPIDPITGQIDWITRSYADDPNSRFSDDKDVYDVYSASNKTALDGTEYADW